MTNILLSYARGDDVDPSDLAACFVARLYRDLTARGFEFGLTAWRCRRAG